MGKTEWKGIGREKKREIERDVSMLHGGPSPISIHCKDWWDPGRTEWKPQDFGGYYSKQDLFLEAIMHAHLISMSPGLPVPHDGTAQFNSFHLPCIKAAHTGRHTQAFSLLLSLFWTCTHMHAQTQVSHAVAYPCQLLQTHRAVFIRYGGLHAHTHGARTWQSYIHRELVKLRFNKVEVMCLSLSYSYGLPGVSPCPSLGSLTWNGGVCMCVCVRQCSVVVCVPSAVANVTWPQRNSGKQDSRAGLQCRTPEQDRMCV